jgi:hypothetical protein
VPHISLKIDSTSPQLRPHIIYVIEQRVGTSQRLEADTLDDKFSLDPTTVTRTTRMFNAIFLHSSNASI